MARAESAVYTSVPLSRGLMILERIARSTSGLAFSDILLVMDAPRASVARLIRALLAEGYIAKRTESGRYSLGPRMGVFGRTEPVRDRLRGAVRGILEGISDDTRNTSMFIYWDGEACECLDKVMLPESISMQHVGTRNADLSVSPWGWAIYAELDGEKRERARSAMSDERGFTRDLKRHAPYYEKHSFAYDDCEHFPGVRRLAAIVTDADDEIVGAFCLGASPLVVSDRTVTRIGKRLVVAARELERLMGWTSLSGSAVARRPSSRTRSTRASTPHSA